MYVSTGNVPSANDRQIALLFPHHLFVQRRRHATLQWYNKGFFDKPNCLRIMSAGRTCAVKVNNNSPKILQRDVLCMSPICNAMNPFALFIRKFQIATQSLFIVGSASCRSWMVPASDTRKGHIALLNVSLYDTTCRVLLY